VHKKRSAQHHFAIKRQAPIQGDVINANMTGLGNAVFATTLSSSLTKRAGTASSACFQEAKTKHKGNKLELGKLTVWQARDVIADLMAFWQEKKQHPYEIGRNYVIRTVTMIYTGRLIEVGDKELVLVDAAWIPEPERHMQFVANGMVRECEPFPDGQRVIIGRGALMDAIAVDWDLPRGQR